MLLQAPQESPYDLNFVLFGFPIRIAWTFWIGAIVIGYNLSKGIDVSFPGESPGLFPLLFLWSGSLLVSILIHELGHAFAFRYYGMESSIVLYHFGGLAIPSSMGRSGFAHASSSRRMDEMGELWIALAGPVAQLASAALLVIGVVASGYQVIAFANMPWPLSNLMRYTTGAPIENIGLMSLVFFYVLPSVLWALLNLLPVFPLDGGRVMRSLVLISGDRSDTWIWISLVSAGAVALYCLQGKEPLMGLLFLSLAVGNYQMLQQPYR